jgi:hypothetical protein
MGAAPENWEKSFRAAARYCLCRILRERGEVGREPAGDQQGDQFRNESGENQDGRSPA